MEYYFYFQPLFYSFVIAGFLLACFIFFAKKRKFIEKRICMRHIHVSGISRFGGVALIISFIVALLLDSRLVIDNPLLGVLIAVVAILIFGVIDDIKQLGWKSQLLFQFAVVAFVYFMGVRLQYISNPLGGIFFFNSGAAYFLGMSISIIWMMFLMNVMNWADGVDGVSGGITFIAVATIFILSQRPEINQPPIGIITAAILGGLMAFILYNFYPAKIIAGTSGSMFMGLILAILAIFAGAKMATTLMVLAVPIIDALWVIAERIYIKKSIFIADRRHLHYRLLELGWSVKKICLLYYIITAIIAILALNMKAVGKISTFSIIAIILLASLATIAKKIGNMDERNKKINGNI